PARRTSPFSKCSRSATTRFVWCSTTCIRPAFTAGIICSRSAATTSTIGRIISTTSPAKAWRGEGCLWPRSCGLAAFAHPSRGQAADEEQEPDQPAEQRQHADAAHHARFAHPQSQPVVALVGVARAHADDPRYVHAAAVFDPH